MITRHHSEGLRNPRALWGIGLVFLGVVLLVDRLNVLDAGAILRYWPVLLIAFGIQRLYAPGRAAGMRPVNFSGVAWIAIGGMLLLSSLGLIQAGVRQLFWPMILILVGVQLVLRSRRGMGHAGDGSPDGNIVAVMSGVQHISAAVPFTGADVTAVMGGTQIDLRRAHLQPGGEAAIDLFVIMGGCELMVPPDWVVSAPVTAILGGVDDQRLVAPQRVIDAATPQAGQPPRLVLRGFVLLGGVTLR